MDFAAWLWHRPARIHAARRRTQQLGTWLGSLGLIGAALGVTVASAASAATGCAAKNVAGHSSLCWTHRTRSTSPPARFSNAMATDPATGKVVLFGGDDVSGFPLGDTWTWDGTTWTQQHPTSSPSARRFPSMATDRTSGHLVLFGGSEGSTNLGDTWTWDGTTWTQQHPTSSPSAREAAAMATDQATGHIVLFGGLSGLNSLGDTWTWNGTNWTQHSPVTSPPARENAAIGADPVSGRVVLFGGFSSAELGDTWTWDGATWKHQHPANSPSARFYVAMATDPATGHVVLFGGSTTHISFGDTWTWDGATWTHQHPANSPSSRGQQTMDIDPNGRVLLFGGGPGSGNDTWSITPSLTITPNSGPAGTPVSVHAFGYTPGAIAKVKYKGGTTTVAICAHIVVAADTTFTCTGHIPSGSAAGSNGIHFIVGKDSAGLQTRTHFLLN
jgi:hypothetical protein